MINGDTSLFKISIKQWNQLLWRYGIGRREKGSMNDEYRTDKINSQRLNGHPAIESHSNIIYNWRIENLNLLKRFQGVTHLNFASFIPHRNKNDARVISRNANFAGILSIRSNYLNMQYSDLVYLNRFSVGNFRINSNITPHTLQEIH